MKITYRNLGIVSFILFTLSILVIGYLLYSLPGDVHQHAQSMDKNQLQKVSGVVTRLGIVVGIGFFNGLLAILFLLLGAKSYEVQTVVYSNIVQEEKHETEESTVEDEEALQKEHEARLQRLAQVIAAHQSKGTREKLEKALGAICNELEACQGALYVTTEIEGKKCIEFYAGYAFYLPDSQRLFFEFGEGVAGQVAKEGKAINFQTVPENYITILSGLGKSSPNHLIITPIYDVQATAVLGVVEIASFKAFSAREEELIGKFSHSIAALIQEIATVKESV